MSSTIARFLQTLTFSSIWEETMATRLVWFTMFVMADRKGHVEASVPGLANFARVSVDEARTALDRLLAPDPDSQWQDHEGRHIEETERGWRILNYDWFKRDSSAEIRRGRDSERKRARRQGEGVKHPQTSPASA